MRLDTAISFVAVAGLGSLYGVSAWGAAGHEIVATIAQIHLNPPVVPLLCSILYPNSSKDFCYLSSVATWADSVRYRSEFRWSAPLHYVGAVGDHPSDSCVFPGDRGWSGRQGGNVLAGIRNVTGLLEDFVKESKVGVRVQTGVKRTVDDGLGTAQEALKFLIHFLGDLHQPLHLTGRDRGGNGDKVSWDGRVTNLHSLWDGLLIAKALRSMPSSSNYSHPLPIPAVESVLRGAIYDPYIRRIMWEGIGVGEYSTTPGKWEDEVEQWLECPSTSARIQIPSFASGPIQMLSQFFRQTVLDLFAGGGIQQETDDEILCPQAWAEPIHQLNCDLVWPKELDEPPYGSSVREDTKSAKGMGARKGTYLELDTPEYAGRITNEWVVERLLAMGGIRLAGILNEIFAPLVESGAQQV